MNTAIIPRLVSLSKAAIVKFKKEYEEYQRDLEAANRDKSAQQRTNLRKLNECIDQDLLEEVKEQIDETYYDEEEEGELDFNEKLIRFLDSILSKESFDMKKIKLANDLAKVKLDSSVEDHQARVLMLKKDLRKTLRENGLNPADVFADAEKFGSIIKMLVENDKSLNPPEIRAWIKHALDGRRSKMDAKEFADILEEKIKVLNDARRMSTLSISYGYGISMELKDRRQKPNQSGQASSAVPKESSNPGRREGSSKGEKNGSSASKRGNPDRAGCTGIPPNKRPKTESMTLSCWGCKGPHSLKNCDKISEADRVRISQEKGRKISNSKPSDNYFFLGQIGPSVSVYNLLLNGVSVQVTLDDGSDRSIVSQRWLDDFRESHHHINAIQLATQQKILLADKKTIIRSNSYIVANLTLNIYQGLHLRNRKFFVVLEDIGNPIIGHSELEELGIDTKSVIERLSFAPEDPSEDETSVDRDDSTKVSLDMAIQQMLSRARKNDMPLAWWNKLCKLVNSYKDIFRVEIVDDEPADVTPMDISFKEGVTNKTWSSYNLKYSKDELAWLKSHIDTLEKHGFVYRNPHARYSSPALVVKKPGSVGEYRLCVDVKRPNSLVEATHWPMPHMDVLLRKLSLSSVYAKLDAFKGYWMFPVTEQCGELYSIKTPFGVFTPRRIVQGAQEAVRYFQAGMEEALSIKDRDDLLLWVDDILAHAATPQGLLQSLEHTFKSCRDRKICLSARKCDLFLKQVTWCGRTISSEGVGFDPSYIQGVFDLELPQTVGDLQQFICGMNWVRSTIPNYNTHMAILLNCLKDISAKIGTNKKKILHRRLLSQYEEWEETAKDAFFKAKDLLKNSIMMTHRDSAQRLCVFPDASDKHWGLFITQVPYEDLALPYEEQRHSPLLMMSGSFSGSQTKWHIREKEAYPIMIALDKARELLKEPFSLFTDHKNLVWVLDPNRRQVLKHADDRLSRWALSLMSFVFTVEHIAGEQNVVADMLSRWKLRYPQTVSGASFQPLQAETSSMHEGFVWPSLDQVEKLQEAFLTAKEIEQMSLIPKTLQSRTIYVRASKGRSKDNRIYVPDLESLRERLCVIAHQGISGHRGFEQTFRSIQKRFYWPQMCKHVKKFCELCLHCSVADPRMIIPRPLGQQLHAQKRNEILHYDFIHVGHSVSGESYMLVILDDFSGYVNLYPCHEADAEVVVKALLNWYSLFGLALCHVSDQGSHFKNRVVEELNRRMTTKHHFTLPYTPWSNGTIERVNREIRRLIRVWNSEFRIQLTEWPSLVPLMTYVLNFSVSPRLEYPPSLIFGGFTTESNLDLIFSQKEFKSSKVSFEGLTEHVKQLRESLDSLHKEINDKNSGSSSRRGNYQIPRNRPNFDKGDFVMFATRRGLAGPSKNSKPRWTGPYQVTKCCSDWDYIIKHLVTGEEFHSHAARLKFYCDSSLEVSLDLKYQIAHDEMRYQVDTIEEYAFQDDEHKLLIHWKGFDKEDSTWEPFSVICEDVPSMVKDFVLQINKADLKNRLLSLLQNV